VMVDGSLSNAFIRELIDESYMLVVEKLSGRLKKELLGM